MKVINYTAGMNWKGDNGPTNGTRYHFQTSYMRYGNRMKVIYDATWRNWKGDNGLKKDLKADC